MTWQCIAEGANGLIYYSWFDLYSTNRNAGLDFPAYWSEFKNVVQEVKDIAPVLLSVEETPAIAAPEAEWLNWTVKRAGKTTYLIAVNNTPEPHTISFTLPKQAQSARETGTGEALTLEDGRALPLDFPPLGVRRCEIAGL